MFTKEMRIFKGSANLLFTKVHVQKWGGNSVVEKASNTPPKNSNNYKLVFIGAQPTESFNTKFRRIYFLLFSVFRPSLGQSKLSYKTTYTTAQWNIYFCCKIQSINQCAVTMLLDKAT